jgi:hypothetical protein
MGHPVRVGENNIVCSNTLELLGVRYDRKMSAAPHVDDMAKSAKQRAGLVAPLSHHLPRGRLLCQLASGLVFGKLNHALGAVAAPRLHHNTPTNGRMASVQVAVNDVARSVIGGKRSDRVAVLELNARAQFPLVNELVTKTVAMVTWAAFHSRDGNPKGGRNPLGAAMFDGTGYSRPPGHPRPARQSTPCLVKTCSCPTASRFGTPVRSYESQPQRETRSERHTKLLKVFPSIARRTTTTWARSQTTARGAGRPCNDDGDYRRIKHRE